MVSLTPTQKKIHTSAMRHFMADGYQCSSLRRIVAEAGFTLGAFYGYYNSKEDLFDALVGETAQGIVDIISRMGDEINRLSPVERLNNMTKVFTDGLPELLDYLLGHLDETRLLLKCADGTKYENFLEGLMERDLASMKEMSGESFPLHPLAAGLLVRSYFSLFGDAALSGGTREEIRQAMEEIQNMFAGGMLYLIKGGNINERI